MKYYTLDGHQPVAVDTFPHDLLADISRRQVAEDMVGTARVSTVFLCIDHNWSEGPPLLFETMVFGGSLDNYCERYCTWEDAERGHVAAVAKVITSALSVEP